MTPLWSLLLLISLLVLINALFVAAEFAPIAAPRAAIDARAADGSRLARMLRPLLHDPRRLDRYVATVQLGITLTTIGLGMYGEHELSQHLLGLFGGDGAVAHAGAHAAASALALIAMTVLHVVVGEMVPKSVALASPVSVAMWLIPFMTACRLLLWPIVWLVERTSRLSLRLLRVDRDGAGHYFTSEDLEEVVESSEQGGALSPESGQVLRDLLAFAERTAAEAMVPRVAVKGIPLGCPAEELARILRQSRHTRHPIYDRDLDHIVGGAHIKRLWRDHLLTGRPVTVASARAIPFVPETMRLDRVLQVMREHDAHMAVVMDEHGGTAGLITVEDLFEEVVGEIHEGEGRDPIQDLAEGGVAAAGTARLDELGEHLGLTLEHEEADTVSGLVLLLLGRPARIGDAVTFAGLRFLVTSVMGKGVAACRVQRLPEPADDPAA